MIRSMTGFGKAVTEFQNKTITVEVRSLNSKGADISLRLSSSLRNYELELRNELSRKLERGKIDLSIFIESKEAETPVEINIDLAKQYHRQITELAAALKTEVKDPLSQILKMPDVLKNEKKETDKEEWSQIKKCIDQAIKELDAFRIREGESLKNDFETRLGKIGENLLQIETLDFKRMDNIKKRIKNNLEEILGKDKYDVNRMEQELIYYIEKLDLNEEKVRLKTHLDYFLSTMNEDGAGRKLNFIGQEIGREINTIGSKANDAGLQKIVVLMKDELEKIKEQTNNVL